MIKRRMERYLNNFRSFDKVQNFRIINLFFVSVGLSILGPIMITLKGTFLAVWIISMFSIGSMLAVKANSYIISRFSLEQVYKATIITHILLIVIAIVYFFNPHLMVYLDSTLLIFDVAIFSTYSIMLTNYLTEHTPEDMSRFQVIRNSVYADASLIGLIIVGLLNYFFAIEVSIIIFIIYNLSFSIYLLYNWNFYDKLGEKDESNKIN